MKKYTHLLITIVLICLLLSSCSPTTSNDDSENSYLTQPNNETELEDTEVEELSEYEYNPERTFYTKVLELGELMPDDANAETYEAMETVISNKYRKILQDKYDQGYYFSLEGRHAETDDNSNPPFTGNIIMYLNNDTKKEILTIGIENFDFTTAREKFEQENERQRAKLQTELEEALTSQNQSTNINSYEDAIQVLKNELGDADDTEYPHIFTDLGFVEDSRPYYYIDVRQQGDEMSMAVGRVRVYSDNGEIIWE